MARIEWASGHMAWFASRDRAFKFLAALPIDIQARAIFHGDRTP